MISTIELIHYKLKKLTYVQLIELAVEIEDEIKRREK
tara:strand:- start:42 stop:152 length:111 start_codon:yes stop_codon:yes gene_type:complete